MYSSLPQLLVFLFDVLSVAVFVIRDRFVNKSRLVLKSLSLCNKVLSCLVYSEADNTNARHMALALVLTLNLLFRPHLHRQTFHYISGNRQIHAACVLLISQTLFLD